MVQLDYRDARPIYTQIADDLRQQILAGVLLAGDRLPSVREMAGQLSINPNTIQRAYRELENQGWVASVSGKGCFVMDNHNTLQQQRALLLQQLDDTVEKLLTLGVRRAELADRIIAGGKDHA